MNDTWNRRDVIAAVTVSAAAAGGIPGTVRAAESSKPAASAADKAAAKTTSRAEKNKRIVREARQGSQMVSLPSAIPGEEDKFRAEPTGLQGLTPKNMFFYADPPTTAPLNAETLQQLQRGFSSQALGPVFISYGPMLADGEYVIDESESMMYAANGTLYNNMYLTIVRLENDAAVDFHLYQDSHHAWITYGPLGGWPAHTPPTAPRQLRGAPAVPGEVVTGFKVVDQFDLEPQLIRDVAPSASAAPVKTQPGIEGNKALIRGLRQALASGDQSRVNSYFGKGYRHFIAGERPFGWDHLPLQDIYAPLVQHMASPLTLRYGPVLADETRAFEQMVSFVRLDDGTLYNNWHAFIHEIRNNKIVQTREYLDTRHVWTVLGRWAPWGATPVPPRSRPRRSNLQGIAMTVQYKPNTGPDFDRWRPFPPVS
jgi:uncharacterized protein